MIFTLVRLARVLDVGFLATASRHAYGMTMSRLKNGLAIDLSLLNSIHINDSVATIGPGATTDQVMNAVDKAGFQIRTFQGLPEKSVFY